MKAVRGNEKFRHAFIHSFLNPLGFLNAFVMLPLAVSSVIDEDLLASFIFDAVGKSGRAGWYSGVARGLGRGTS